jgi:hypothetical protein
MYFHGVANVLEEPAASTWRLEDGGSMIFLNIYMYQKTLLFKKDSDTKTHTVFICFILWEGKQFTTM